MRIEKAEFAPRGAVAQARPHRHAAAAAVPALRHFVRRFAQPVVAVVEEFVSVSYTHLKGEMIQLDNLITLEENVAPPQLYHYNRFLSATVSAGLAKGKTIGQGLDEMDRIAEQTLGDDFRTALAGDSKEMCIRDRCRNVCIIFFIMSVLSVRL